MALPPCGFLCNVLCCRNCQYDGSVYGFSYPRNPSDLNKMGAEWATQALTASGFLPEGVTVATIECVVPETVGLLSELRFATLTYASNTSSAAYLDLATTMCVKFAPPDLITRITTDLFELLRTEFRFYADTAMSTELAKLGVTTPKCYYADMNMKSNNLCILLEKLDGEFKDQLADAIAIDEAKLVIEVLGKINGRWHGQDKQDDPMIAFINRTDAEPYKLFFPTADGALKKVDRYKQGGKGWTYVLPRDFVGVWPDFKKSGWAILRHLSMNSHMGVTHGDARLDNFYFYTDSDGTKKCGAIDFQLMIRGDVSSDLVYFVGTSMPADFQKEHLEALFETYLEALHAGGGPKIEKGSDSRVEFEENFDLCLCFLLTKLIIGAGGIDPSAPRAIEQMDQLLNRMIALYTHRNAITAYVKFRAGTMIAQRGEGVGLAQIGLTPFEVTVVDAPVNPIPDWN